MPVTWSHCYKMVRESIYKEENFNPGSLGFLLWAHGDRVHFMARVHGEEVAHFTAAKEQRRVRFSGANTTISSAIVLQERDLYPGP